MALYFICSPADGFQMQIKVFVLAKGNHLQSGCDLVEGLSSNVNLYLNDHLQPYFPDLHSWQPFCLSLILFFKKALFLSQAKTPMLSLCL